MKTIELIKNNKKITDVESWFKIAPPEGLEKQWVDKHSAKELARYFTKENNKLPVEIEDAITDCDSVSVHFIGEPECETELYPYGFGKGHARQHDLLLVGDDIVVGIEAKATETLDKYVTEIYKGTQNHKLRYGGLCKEILGKDIYDCFDIRYQLLSSTIGTLIEAQKRNIKKALVTIILFSSDITSKEHICSTQEDIDIFRNQLIKNGKFYTAPFDTNIELYIKFIEIHLE